VDGDHVLTLVEAHVLTVLGQDTGRAGVSFLGKRLAPVRRPALRSPDPRSRTRPEEVTPVVTMQRHIVGVAPSAGTGAPALDPFAGAPAVGAFLAGTAVPAVDAFAGTGAPGSPAFATDLRTPVLPPPRGAPV
jgi:hypothetical protein